MSTDCYQLPSISWKKSMHSPIWKTPKVQKFVGQSTNRITSLWRIFFFSSVYAIPCGIGDGCDVISVSEIWVLGDRVEWKERISMSQPAVHPVEPPPLIDGRNDAAPPRRVRMKDVQGMPGTSSDSQNQRQQHLINPKSISTYSPVLYIHRTLRINDNNI